MFAFCINGNDINDRVYIGNERTSVAVVPESNVIVTSNSPSYNEIEFMTYIVDEYIDISADITRQSNEDGETSYFINSFGGELWGEYSEKGYDYLIEYSGGALSDVNNNGKLYLDGMRIIQYYQVYPTLKEAMENRNNYR